jgi:RNA polymerase sigma factor (sigma-70 family)
LFPPPSRFKLAAVESRPEPPQSHEVIAALVNNHRDFLAFLQSRVGDRAQAEDILQEAFVRGMHKVDGLEGEKSAITWFYRVLRNAVIDHHRRRAASSRKLEAYALELERHVEPEADMHSVVCQCVAHLAGTLKPEYADALRRVEIDGMAVRDYASEAGITSSNAAVRVFRARGALSKQLQRSCGTCAEHGCLDCTCESSSGHRP